MDRIRVASVQYFIRPVRTFEEFRDQVEGLVLTAKDNNAQLILFPEYFTLQLLTLGDVKRPMLEQIRGLGRQSARVVEVMGSLARRHGLYIAAGTIPTLDPQDEQTVYNDCYFFSPKGEFGVQSKLHMTRWEAEKWNVAPRRELRMFETSFGRVGITVCYDVEFPELARAYARKGANLLLVPSCTDDRQGYLRVRYCAQARAIENQMYVMQSSTVGSLPMVPAVSLNYGQAAILTPSDFSFSRDGILAEGIPNQESMIIGELNLRVINEAREDGTVVPLLDAERTTTRLVLEPEVVRL